MISRIGLWLIGAASVALTGRTSAFSSTSLLHRRTSQPTSTTTVFAKLWDRLQIEEDPEPFWYVLNCVATQEIDLLRQCRESCADLEDVVKFVVPTEKKTRSHGANKMVTQTKVKYQGYVFGKLRLCPEVYETIQSLDLCRSWMGTVNHKGHKKLPPAPVALNEDEIEKFGLEDLEDEEDEEEQINSDVIVDIEDDEDFQKKIDQDAVKLYLGFKVEDMVKVTAPGKFYDEDGIVRRLKDGKIFVRFYTYGSMYEEWLKPKDLRKLSGEEILRGLSGPSQPITQEEFDGPRDRYDYEGSRPGDLRRSLTRNLKGGNTRNRRQDRVARSYNDNDLFGRSDEERRREERNWNWYQDKQQSRGRKGDFRDGGSRSFRSGSGDRDDDRALGDADAQWGRKPQRQARRENSRVARNDADNRRNEAAIQGNDDWSAFVSSSTESGATKGKKSDDDDFFASLMSDLSTDLTPSTKGSSSSSSDSDGDDFFASLLNDLGENVPTSPAPSPKRKDSSPSFDDEDFFASLEAELGSAVTKDVAASTKDDRVSDSSSDPGLDDDFFANLESELSPLLEKSTFSEEKPVSEPAKKQKPSGGSSSSADLSGCTIPELKSMLKDRGLKVSGKKAELIERLQEHSS